MTIPRASLVAALVFVCGFDLAVQGLLGQSSRRDIVELRTGLVRSLEQRDCAQDAYDAAIYTTLFEPSKTSEPAGAAKSVAAQPRATKAYSNNGGGARARGGT